IIRWLAKWSAMLFLLKVNPKCKWRISVLCDQIIERVQILFAQVAIHLKPFDVQTKLLGTRDPGYALSITKVPAGNK
ncbi:hypothetical protein KI387_030546, partial [Taxus chinensis]